MFSNTDSPFGDYESALLMARVVGMTQSIDMPDHLAYEDFQTIMETEIQPLCSALNQNYNCDARRAIIHKVACWIKDRIEQFEALQESIHAA